MLDGERVDATKHTRESWLALQSSEERRQLVMPLCGVRAVAKARGETKFFAHLSTAGCGVEHGGETPQHLAMKEALALGIDRVPGWHAIIEHPYPSREWIVDVLAESDDGARKVAFEVQLSSQTPDRYASRSQRYFDGGIFPVWLVPRELEYSPIAVPAVVTGFGKSSDIPEDVEQLLRIDVDLNFIQQAKNLDAFIGQLLHRGPHWPKGSPTQQAEARKAEEERRIAQLKAEEAKRAAFELAVQQTNERSAPASVAFGPHRVPADSDIFIWATLNACWKCEEPMLVWAARSPGQGKRWTRVPEVQARDEVGLKRFENRPEIHRVVDRWIKEIKADVPKAVIRLRRTKASGKEYSAFCCPACDAVVGQVFLHRLRPEKWSLISGPEIAAAAARSSKSQPRQRKSAQPRVPPPATLRTVPALDQSPRMVALQHTWAELHSEEGVADARRKFRGTRS
ncbi:competence protein CoiA family protein [Arthrobacter sp. Bi26]|uniref:competence protein CoiA n=1 Tax=Arthrobacter sp. Bi26 TaxID=2822350 RepID=UPI001E43CF8A|nr:competence protein CoiA family protein [Arthrobacter sp. Bi26]